MKLGVISTSDTITPSLQKVTDILYNIMVGGSYVWDAPTNIIANGSKDFQNCVKNFSDIIIFCKYVNVEDLPPQSKLRQIDNIDSPASPIGSPRGSPRDSPRGSPRGSPRISSRKNSPRKNALLDKMLDTCTHIIVFCKTGIEPETLMALRRTSGDETLIYKIKDWTE
jgi:hypothetical protein